MVARLSGLSHRSLIHSVIINGNSAWMPTAIPAASPRVTSNANATAMSQRRIRMTQAVALIVPNALTAPAFVHAKGFAPARVKHYLNDVGPITAANALELFLSLFAG